MLKWSRDGVGAVVSAVSLSSIATRGSAGSIACLRFPPGLTTGARRAAGLCGMALRVCIPPGHDEPATHKARVVYSGYITHVPESTINRMIELARTLFKCGAYCRPALLCKVPGIASPNFSKRNSAQTATAGGTGGRLV